MNNFFAFGNTIYSIFLCFFWVLGNNSFAQNSSWTEDQKYVINYQSSEKALQIRQQNELESQIQWEWIEREERNKRLRLQEYRSSKTFEELKSRNEWANAILLKENKMYTVPEENAFYLFSSSIGEDKMIVFYKNKKGEVLKIAKFVSKRIIVVYYPESPNDKQILIQDYIKAQSGSILALIERKNLEELLGNSR